MTLDHVKMKLTEAELGIIHYALIEYQRPWTEPQHIDQIERLRHRIDSCLAALQIVNEVKP